MKRLLQLFLNLVQVKAYLWVEAESIGPVESIPATVLVSEYEKLLIVVLVIFVAEHFLRLLQPVFLLPNVDKVPLRTEEERSLACNIHEDRVVGSEVHVLHEFLRALLSD